MGTQTVDEIIAIIGSTFLPITIVNTLGVALFAYFAKDHIAFAAGTGRLFGRNKQETGEQPEEDTKMEEK